MLGLAKEARMKRLPFKKSKTGSIGVELELQLIDPESYALISRSKDIIRSLKTDFFQTTIKPEITQSMIEINSTIHHSTQSLLAELMNIHEFLQDKARQLDIFICGGGTHPFGKWMQQKIFPAPRYKRITRKFRYLSKRSTVFGQHIHFGCHNSEEALYLTHALGRYVPHFIALSGSSPFYLGIDTGFTSSRSNVFSSFPQSGHIPYLLSWQEFSDYYYKLRKLGIIISMKDFYWDIRPKPEFGTVEIRVCDTPLSIHTAVSLAAYVQGIGLYLMKNKPFPINKDLYYLYTQNRFHANRYGLEGQFINPFSFQETSIAQDILATMEDIEPYTRQLESEKYIELLKQRVHEKNNDATLLRQLFKKRHSFRGVVKEQCKIWSQCTSLREV
jgi:carboxylate-amine ligase